MHFRVALLAGKVLKVLLFNSQRKTGFKKQGRPSHSWSLLPVNNFL